MVGVVVSGTTVTRTLLAFVRPRRAAPPDHYALVSNVARVLHDALFAGLVQAPRLAANVGFVHFDLAARHAAGQIILHGESDAMQHRPCRFLSHA